MTQDIVERLIAWKSPWRGDGNEETIPLAAEAAAEIVALREALAETVLNIEGIIQEAKTVERRAKEHLAALASIDKGDGE